jgi:hypothetical protein
MHIRPAVLGLFLLTAAATTNAATLTCSGRISQLNYHSPDRFMLQLDSMNAPVFFCNPSTVWSVAGTGYTTSPESCRTMVGLFQSGKLSDRTLAVVYFDGDEVPASCNGWSSWQNANIRYFAWAD